LSGTHPVLSLYAVPLNHPQAKRHPDGSHACRTGDRWATGAYLASSHAHGARTVDNSRVDSIYNGPKGNWLVIAGDRSVHSQLVVYACGGWAGERVASPCSAVAIVAQAAREWAFADLSVIALDDQKFI